MSTIVVGDLHGRKEIVEKVLKLNKTVVFVGDYVDSFNRSIDDQRDTLFMVLDAIEIRDDVVGLWGNHEVSYIDVAYRASGWKPAMSAHLQPVASRMHDLLKYYVVIEDDWLVTHAGVSNQWLPVCIPHNVKDICAFLDEVPFYNLAAVGRNRGGVAPVGGPLWCDYYSEFDPIYGVKQIFGHTAYRTLHKIINNRDNYNVDCLDYTPQVLEVDGSKATPIMI